MAAPSALPGASASALASLYVGDLRHDVTDGQLFNHFSEFKSLTSVRVCRDLASGRSLCYGYVNFISPHDAVRAIEVKNHTMLNGKAIRVTWSHRDPGARKSGIGNVFVKNLSDSINNAKLQEMFQKFGNILSCKVVVSDDGRSKGYGFVQFESEESANAAIDKLNGFHIGGKQMYVNKFVRRSDRILPDAKYTNLYIKNLDTNVTEDFLKKKFSEFGKILSLVISKDDHGESKGFGFVNFDNPDDARRAMEAMNGLQLGSKILYVARAQKRAEREQILRNQFEEKRKEKIMKYQDSNVYVKNVDDGVTDDELRGHFAQCGTIISAKLMRDEKGISKGFGFVCFSKPEEANKAVATLHGFMFHGKPLYVAIAQRKEERLAQLQIQYAQHMAGLMGSSTVIPGLYPSLYYTAPPGVVAQVPPQLGLIYHPLPGWRANGFGSSIGPVFHPSRRPMISNTPRQQRQNRGRMNGQRTQGGGRFYYVSHVQQSSESVNTSNDSSNQQTGMARYVSNGLAREMTKGSEVSSAVPISGGAGYEGSEMLSSRLAAAPPEHQKQILGEWLYPLMEKYKPDLAAKVTGMLLEMDNSELLLLLESPDLLAAKVEEAVQALNLSRTTVSGQDSLQPIYLSAEVAVS